MTTAAPSLARQSAAALSAAPQPVVPYLGDAQHDAEALAAALAGGPPLRVAFVTCSYDTGFEPVAEQVVARVEELTRVFGADGPVRWSLWIVDDLPRKSGFSAQIEEGFKRCAPGLRHEARLRCVPLTSSRPRREGLKGRALLDGMKAALAEGYEVMCYINLNLKVPASLAATGLRRLHAGGWDAVIGSRAPIDGGRALGAGALGKVKSRAYNKLVRTALPSLGRYRDTNAPLKIFTAEAARCLVDKSRIPTVTMDAEWLMLLHEHGFEVTVFPVVWVQRQGSRPPWSAVPACAWDVWKIHRRWRTLTDA